MTLCARKNPQENPYHKTYFKKVHTFFNNIKHKNIRYNTKQFYDQISKVTVLIRSVNIRTDILKCSVGSFQNKTPSRSFLNKHPGRGKKNLDRFLRLGIRNTKSVLGKNTLQMLLFTHYRDFYQKIHSCKQMCFMTPLKSGQIREKTTKALLKCHKEKKYC